MKKHIAILCIAFINLYTIGYSFSQSNPIDCNNVTYLEDTFYISVNNNLSTKLESYRKMKVGEIAPEIYFDYDMIYNKMIGNNVIKKMTDINSDYYIIIFGSSWCSKCIEDSPKLNQLYSQWESNGYEVIFVSLDHNKEDFISSFSNFDFYSICDYQNWNSKTVKDYYVSSTPSIFVLNKNRKIILRPRSINHLSSWVEWHSKEQVEK